MPVDENGKWYKGPNYDREIPICEVCKKETEWWESMMFETGQVVCPPCFKEHHNEKRYLKEGKKIFE